MGREVINDETKKKEDQEVGGHANKIEDMNKIMKQIRLK